MNYDLVRTIIEIIGTITIDLFENPVGSLTSPAFFQAKALQKCDFVRKLFRN
jgi:hypothetical protein